METMLRLALPRLILLICPTCLANWLRTTLRAYHQHLGLGLVLDEASTASKFFRAHLPCDRMIEVMREGHPRARPMNADDPVHPCRKGGPRTNERWWLAENEAAVEQLWQAEAGEAPLGGSRSGRGAARRDGSKTSWSYLTIFLLQYSPFFASVADGLKNRRTDPGVGQSAGTRSA